MIHFYTSLASCNRFLESHNDLYVQMWKSMTAVNIFYC